MSFSQQRQAKDKRTHREAPRSRRRILIADLEKGQLEEIRSRTTSNIFRFDYFPSRTSPSNRTVPLLLGRHTRSRST